MPAVERLNNAAAVGPDQKLCTMVILSGVLTVVIISWVDSPPKNVNMRAEFDTFLTVWIPIYFLAIVWTFLIETYPPPFSLEICIEILWTTGLLALLFIFLNHLDGLDKGARDMWGEIAGPILVGIFLSCWAFIVLNYHLGRTTEPSRSSSSSS